MYKAPVFDDTQIPSLVLAAERGVPVPLPSLLETYLSLEKRHDVSTQISLPSLSLKKALFNGCWEGDNLVYAVSRLATKDDVTPSGVQMLNDILWLFAKWDVETFKRTMSYGMHTPEGFGNIFNVQSFGLIVKTLCVDGNYEVNDLLKQVFQPKISGYTKYHNQYVISVLMRCCAKNSGWTKITDYLMDNWRNEFHEVLCAYANDRPKVLFEMLFMDSFRDETIKNNKEFFESVKITNTEYLAKLTTKFSKHLDKCSNLYNCAMIINDCFGKEDVF